MITVHIYGCRPEIYERAEKIGIPPHRIHVDDRPDGGTPLYVAKKAWLAPIEDGETHRCVLQDDVEVSKDFHNKLKQLIDREPKGVFSLFPLAFLDKCEIGDAKVKSGKWIFQTVCVSGCAVLMPTEYITECWENAQEGLEDDDEQAIINFLVKTRCKHFTTLPSTVQHIGTECLIKNAVSELHGDIHTYYFDRG